MSPQGSPWLTPASVRRPFNPQQVFLAYFLCLCAAHFPAGAGSDVLGSRHSKGVQRHPDLEGNFGFMLGGSLGGCIYMGQLGVSLWGVTLPPNSALACVSNLAGCVVDVILWPSISPRTRQKHLSVSMQHKVHSKPVKTRGGRFFV